MKQKQGLVVLKAFVTLLAINILAGLAPKRFDLTEDQRYTLSKAALNSVAAFKNTVIVDVLLGGDLSPEFTKLKLETLQILDEFAAENKNIKYNFVDPFEGVESPETVVADLQRMGLTPTRLTTGDPTKITQDILFPWALVNHNNKTVRVKLLKNKLGASEIERVNQSVQQLEYVFADAFTKINLTTKKKIAVIKGNGEMQDQNLADLLTTLGDYYNIGAITLDSVTKNPQATLNSLRDFDLAFVAKPTQAFTDEEKFVLDQFVVGGGKSIWLIDQVNIELDSLFNQSGSTMAMPRNLNLKDFFFSYGVRVNPNLINDLYFTQIVLASGEGNNASYNPVPWYYSPMVFSRNDHPINNNIEAVRMQFANDIDTLKNGIHKTILLYSSPLSKVDGTPRQIHLESVNTPPDKASYTHGNKALAVLLEGAFQSAFTNRVKPLKLQGSAEKGSLNQMIVISDGDVAKNQLRNGRPLELGYDKWTNNFYGNKEFLINCFNYLLDDRGLMNIRSKKVSVPFLDSEKIASQKSTWQVVNLALPLLFVIALQLGFNYYRKRKYGS